MSPLVQLSHIRKAFGPLVALDDVSVALAAGCVHGLLGENGAGKSTLMNILYGLLRPDAGHVLVAGRSRPIRSPQDAIAAGVGMVHQHFMLAGAMTVLDNVLLGDRRQRPWLDRRRAAGEIAELGQRLGLPIDPLARVDRLSVGQQQRVEILKALYRKVEVLILDEPTAVLTPVETKQLFAAVDRLRLQGTAVVFISHKLGEVRHICDDLTILRRGRVAWEGRADTLDEAELARQMVGREVEVVARKDRDKGTRGQGDKEKNGCADPLVPMSLSPLVSSSATLRLESVTANGITDVTLHVNAGEILGVAGVDGNGQQELAEVIVGLRHITAGRVRLGGQDVTELPLRGRAAMGVAHIPNDRNREGLVGSMSVAENVALKRHDQRPMSRLGFIAWGAVRRRAGKLMQRFDIRAPSVDAPVAQLSGGNAQKVILARELALGEPKLIVAMNPVRGLDIAATNFVYEQLLARRAAGCAVLLICSELDELLALCDRVGVLYNGRFTMSRFPDEGSEAIGKMMVMPNS